MMIIEFHPASIQRLSLITGDTAGILLCRKVSSDKSHLSTVDCQNKNLLVVLVQPLPVIFCKSLR